MDRVQVKICGLRTLEGARAAAAAGADFGGINLVPGARRAVGVDQALRLAQAMAPACPVGVFRNQSVTEVARLAREVGLRVVQLHGDESEADVRALAEDFEVIRALAFDRIEALPGLQDVLRSVIVDAREPGAGRRWSMAALPPLEGGRLHGVEVWIAGGLGPSNVGEVVRAVRPAGVDVASGVEVDGVESPDRIAAFVTAARAAGEQGVES